MKTINVDNIPEPVIQAIEVVVRTLREKAGDPAGQHPPVELPIWPGGVAGSLSRAEIYQDAG
jgi:4'-phosphopantetheinyl transferase EntD